MKRLGKIFPLALIAACSANNFEQELPNLDFTGMEQQVVDKIDSLQSAAGLSPDSAEVWGRIGMNLYIHDLRTEAAPYFERAAKLDGNAFKWPYLLAYTYDVLHDPRSVDWYARSLPLRANFAPVHVRYGEALLKAGRIEEAETAFQQAAELHPKTAQSLLGLAQIAFSRKDYERSLDFVNKALRQNPRYGEAYGLLATVHRRMGAQEKSNVAMEKARMFPADTKLRDPVISEMIKEGVSVYWYKYRAREFASRARFNAAIHEYNQALKYKASADTHVQLGRIYQILGRLPAAAEQLLHALNLNPDDLGVMRILLGVYKKSGQGKLARDLEKKINQLENRT